MLQSTLLRIQYLKQLFVRSPLLFVCIKQSVAQHYNPSEAFIVCVNLMLLLGRTIVQIACGCIHCLSEFLWVLVTFALLSIGGYNKHQLLIY